MRTAASNRDLWLAPHVRACRCGDQVILLDLLQGRYLGYGATASKALESNVGGWPEPAAEPSPTTAEPPPPAAVAGLTERLLAQGLIVQGARDSDAAPAVDAAIPEATASLSAEDSLIDAELGPRRIANFLGSAATASWWLRRRSLASIARIVADRRARIGSPAGMPLGPLRSGTAAYERLRPFVFTARDQCLYDSLAMLGFLATEHLFPRWVIGVKSSPFGAHSWVQTGGTVVNDHHEYVRRFHPILVV